MNAKELREKRVRLVTEARGIMDAAQKEERDMSDEEEQKFSKLHDEVDALGDKVKLIERQEDREAEIGESRERLADIQTTKGKKVVPGDIKGAEDRHSEALTAWARRGLSGMKPELRQHLVTGLVDEDEIEFAGMPTVAMRMLPALPDLIYDRGQVRYDWQRRGPQTVTTTGGGYVIGNEPIRGLEDALLAYGGMRKVSNIVRTATGATLPVPTANDTAQTGELLAINTGAAEQPITFGIVNLGAYKYSSKLILVPFELMQDSAFDFGVYVGKKAGERLGRITNTHFTAGSGSSQPNGVKNVANAAVTVAASATAITADELIGLQDTLDEGYDDGASWMMKKSTMTTIRKLKTAAGDQGYIWQPGISSREPDVILGKPYTVNQDMRSIGADKRSVLYGNFSKYWIRDVMDIMLLRLVERYAEKAQIGFVAFSRHDGNIIDAGTNPILALRHPAS